MSALVLRWPSLLPASLLLLGGLYGAELALDDPALDGAAPLFAAGLLVTAELGYWSLEECDAVKAEPGESLRRAAFIALLALGALLVGSLLLVLTDGVRAGGLAVDPGRSCRGRCCTGRRGSRPANRPTRRDARRLSAHLRDASKG
ncbi:MAG: hypothetical protein H0U00_09655 [Actinobacteria bacterium]|nr:hypothetical protein [Actinomycetota bacterium]